MSTKLAVIDRREFLRWTTLAALGTTVSGCAINPVSGKRQFMLISKAQERAMDQQYSPHQFSADYGPSQDAALNAYVDSVARDLAGNSHRADVPYSARVVNAPHVNGYIFPGGSMATTRGIMLAMNSESELGALLGHEVAHVSARHSAQRMSWGLMTQLAVVGAGAYLGTQEKYSDYAPLAMALGSIGAGLLLAKYSRNDEREADAVGLDYAVAAGHNPEGMVDLLQMLTDMHDREPSRLELMFSTHPMSRRRRDTARKQVAEKYSGETGRPKNRERYMDNTASLRAIGGAITHMQTAQTAMMREQYAPALTELDSALRIAPNDYAALLLSTNCLMAMDRIAEARRFAARAKAVYPEEAQAYFAEGVLALKAERFAEASRSFTTYEKMLPGNPNTLLFSGLSFEGMGQREAAAEQYHRYLEAAPMGEASDYARERLTAWQ